jgi:hypothetical protein
MRRFLIFNDLGQAWGIGRGKTPESAVRDLEIQIGGEEFVRGCAYEHIDDRQAFFNESLYVAVPLPPRGRVPSGKTWAEVWRRRRPAVQHRVAVRRGTGTNSDTAATA